MYPNVEIALNKLRTNSLKFLEILNSDMKNLSENELEKFSETDIQIALENAIKSASKRNIPEVHQTLARLIVDRVQKPKKAIVELAIEESIEIVSKLDTNLIKILSFCFIFGRTKYRKILNQSQLFEKLSLVVQNFEKIDITLSKFEYLEAISCGKLQQFLSTNLVDSIVKNYPHLFIKNIPLNKIIEANLPENIVSLCFTRLDENNFKPNEVIGLYFFEKTPVFINNNPIEFTECIKEKLKTIYLKNTLSFTEIDSILCEKIQNFNLIKNLWNDQHCTSFSLTSVGIAIAISYLSKSNLGEFNINEWIN